MTKQEFLVKVREYMHFNPEQRFGQACFNVLYIEEPEVADMIRTTEFDPFYLDSRVDAFLREVFGE